MLGLFTLDPVLFSKSSTTERNRILPDAEQLQERDRAEKADTVLFICFHAVQKYDKNIKSNIWPQKTRYSYAYKLFSLWTS